MHSNLFKMHITLPMFKFFINCSPRDSKMYKKNFEEKDETLFLSFIVYI